MEKGVIIEEPQKYLSRNRFITGFLAGVVVAAVIAGITIAGIYVGSQMSKDKYKEYHTVVTDGYGDPKPEKIIVTQDEEDYQTDEVRAIVDFKSDLVVYDFPENSSLSGSCYVATFNTSNIPLPEKIMSEQAGSEVFPEPTRTSNLDYSITELELNSNILGPRAREVCTGKPVLMLKASGDMDAVGRLKRSFYAKITISFMFVKFEIGFRV